MKKIKLQYHLICIDNSYFAYDIKKHIVLKLESDIYDMLFNFLNSDLTETDICAIISANSQLKMYMNAEILFYVTDISDVEPEFTSGKTACISFPTVHDCNLRCKYCFADHGDNYIGDKRNFNKILIKDILDFVYFKYFKDFNKYRLDFVSGGEPLLNFDVIKDTVEIAEDLYKKTGKKLDIFLCTNGTINNHEIWDFLNTNNINIGISIDGDREAHNDVRVYEDGSGSYDDTVGTINTLIKSDKYSAHTKAAWGLSVINGKTKSIKNILLHNRDLGIKHMQMKLVRLEKSHELAISWNNLEYVLFSYKELNDYFIKCSKKHDYTDLKAILNDNDYYGKLVSRIIDGKKVYRRCIAGIDKISFDGIGNIYPCDSFVGNSKFIIGNIYTETNDDIKRLFLSGTVLKRMKCKSCWAKYLCGGDCYHNSYLANDNIFDPDSVFCELNKRLLEFALFLYFEICSNGDLDDLKKYLKIKMRLNN